MDIYQLMTERIDDRFSPLGYPAPEWTIRGNVAVLDWDSMSGMWLDGTTLKILSPPSGFIALTGQLRVEGWKRGDEHLRGGFGWRIYTYFREQETGAEIRVEATEFYDSWPEKNGAIPFFASAPPPLPSRAGKNQRAAWLAEHEEWQRKCREDEW